MGVNEDRPVETIVADTEVTRISPTARPTPRTSASAASWLKTPIRLADQAPIERTAAAQTIAKPSVVHTRGSTTEMDKFLRNVSIDSMAGVTAVGLSPLALPPTLIRRPGT